MDRFRNQARTLVEAAGLGLLATAVLYLPPASVAARLDAWLFDAWSQLDPPPPAAELVISEAETPTALAHVVEAADNAGAKLVIGTLADAPTTQSERAIGPVEVSVEGLRVRTPKWSRGGHLSFQPDLDGVVRRDTTLRSRGTDLPSLPLYAARVVDPSTAGASDRSTRLLRWPRADAVPKLSATPAAGELEGRIVIAGPLHPKHATPFGFVSTPELVAQVLTSHLGGHYVAQSAPASAAVWCVALLLCIPFLFAVPTERARMLGLLGVAALALPALSAAAFHALALWLPVTGPAAWLLVSGALLVVRRQKAPAPAAASDTDSLGMARRAADGGRLKEAWALYRQLPPTPALFPEIYDLACALASHGSPDEAADLFHWIAQVDGDFRDVAHRLVRTNHLPLEEGMEMPPAIGRYELLEPIGRGSMGNVYLGRDPLINRILALKAIDLSVGYDHVDVASTSDSFLREAAIAGSLSHPNIVTIFDVGESEGLAYIAMEYVRGHHLNEFATRDRLLPVDTVLDLIARAAEALDYAHRRNVVHRDIKPANIMYDSLSNNLKITDFGIAKLIDANRTRTGIVQGTPAFMSPEQLEGKNVNGHTDLFALGVSLYQLLTGQLPFRGASMTNLMFVIANEPHQSVTSVRSELPKWLDEVLDRALAKSPADRFESAAALAAALRRAA
jgi:serine/threonine-protein kinase